jgi:hypothetical protein
MESSAMAPFEHAGDEPRLDDILADPVTHLLMRYDGLSTEDVMQAVECARRRLAPRRPRFPRPSAAFRYELV